MTPGVGSASCSSNGRSDPFISKDVDCTWGRANPGRSYEDDRQIRKKRVALTKMSPVPLP
jgi:hypothetical protein